MAKLVTYTTLRHSNKQTEEISRTPPLSIFSCSSLCHERPLWILLGVLSSGSKTWWQNCPSEALSDPTWHCSFFKGLSDLCFPRPFVNSVAHQSQYISDWPLHQLGCISSSTWWGHQKILPWLLLTSWKLGSWTWKQMVTLLHGNQARQDHWSLAW